jgi:hypothetical protein
LRHTLSSENVREAQRLRIARVTFPQRLLIGWPLRGFQSKETEVSLNYRFLQPCIFNRLSI